MTEVVFIFFVAVFSKRNREMFSVFLLSYSRESWESSKKLWKHSPAAHVPTAFLFLPNFHMCFYNSIETWYMFSIS